jgi:hypothetical protein
VDHIVSHLYHWFAGEDFSEEVACRDQVLMLRRRPGLATTLASVIVALGLSAHKRLPLLPLLR